MNEQDGKQVTPKRRRRRKTHKQIDSKSLSLSQPANDYKKSSKSYWMAQGQPWRFEPEINVERQQFLEERRTITPDFKQGIYPFKDIKLSRADVEWLLATHENGRGPVNWSDESQRERKGLDLRGADLSQVDLSELPLARMIGGVDESEAPKQGEIAAINLSGAILVLTHLEGAKLQGAHLEGTLFYQSNLERANLIWAHLEGANLLEVHLEGAQLLQAHLERANLLQAHLERANLIQAHLERANLGEVNLQRAYILEAHLEGANLLQAHLEGANLGGAHLEGAILGGAHLEGADLWTCFFDRVTNLHSIELSNKQYGSISLADIYWGDVNVGVVDWSALSALGDEHTALKLTNDDGKPKSKQERLDGYRTAVRAYRQLAVVLRNQGLNEDGARFAYRAQLIQRKVFWYQGLYQDKRKFGQYLGSLFVDLLAGYGYRWWRSFLAYLLVIGIFAGFYYHLGTHLDWKEAIVISMTAFHGRGFFPEQFHPGDPQALVAAIEAFVGLLIEVTFIATLTQRLFGK